MINVVYILSSTITTGGASKSFIAMLKELIKKDVRPTVVVPDTGGLYKTLSEIGVKTIVLDYRFCTFPPLGKISDYLLFFPRLAGRLFLNKRASRQLTGILRNDRPNLIHTNVSVINIGYNAARRLGLPHVYHIREYGDLDFNLRYIPSHRRLERQLSRPSSYSICITEDIQRHHKQHDNPSSRIVYNGITRQREHMPSGSGSYFLFAGRIEPAKGLDFLLKAYSNYVRDTSTPLPLHIAGGASDSTYLDHIRKIIRDNGITQNAILLGERTDIDQLMQNAKAIIIPSRFEGFGRVMPEAMFNGCLVIGRNTGGTKEQMDNGMRHTGGEIALRFSTTDELTARLRYADEAPDEALAPYREKAFSTVNALYTTDANAEGVYQMYKDILKCTD